MNIKEMRQAVEILGKEWNLGKKESEAEGNICAWIYLMEILEESEKIITYKEDGELVGFCGYAKWNSKKNLLRKNIAKIIKKKLMNSKKIKNKEAIKKYYENYGYYCPKDLEKKFDGEISILIVKKEYQNKGIGTNLLLEVFKLAKEDGLKKIQILTDESCNHEFYEKCNCKIVYETKIENIESNIVGNKEFETAYVYGKEL